MRPSGSRLRVFIYRLLPPLNPHLSLSPPPPRRARRISARANFSWHEPHPRSPFCAFFARPWGGRGEGYAGAWWPLQRFKSPRRTPTRTTSTPNGPFHSAPPSSGGDVDTFRGVDPLRQETFWKGEGGGSWEEGIKFVPCAGGFYWGSWKIRWLVFSSKVFSVSKWQRSKIIGIIVKKIL